MSENSKKLMEYVQCINICLWMDGRAYNYIYCFLTLNIVIHKNTNLVVKNFM